MFTHCWFVAKRTGAHLVQFSQTDTSLGDVDVMTVAVLINGCKQCTSQTDIFTENSNR